MNVLNSQIVNFYYQPDLYNDIINRLTAMGVDLNNVGRKDISGVDEFHVRGAMVSRELAEMANIHGAKVLDIGCGIGGPCRMLADEYDCDVIGIDLSPEHIETANRLSALVGLNLKTKFIQADATNLPFEDHAFDVVWTQHVQMNIGDKLKFYSEIARVLSHKGAFVYYEVFKKENKEVNFPMPWADESTISFLGVSSQMNAILEGLGLAKDKYTDQTESGIHILEKSLDKMSKHPSSGLGLIALMGASTKKKMTNLLNGLKEGKVHLESGVYRRRQL
ncbi:MAG TPA: class I SAM-dependent methyltransferase [Bacteroidales bacterium]|nr:class I SAM-dependent methyltransferase [Bacteroidales bacterium]